MSDPFYIEDEFVDFGEPGLEEAHFHWVIGQFDNLFDANRTGNIVGAMSVHTVDKLRSYFANKR